MKNKTQNNREENTEGRTSVYTQKEMKGGITNMDALELYKEGKINQRQAARCIRKGENPKAYLVANEVYGIASPRTVGDFIGVMSQANQVARVACYEAETLERQAGKLEQQFDKRAVSIARVQRREELDGLERGNLYYVHNKELAQLVMTSIPGSRVDFEKDEFRVAYV